VDPNASVTGLARAIQLSVAPMFLLTGITALLVAGVVAVLFISAVAALDLAVFVLAMVFLILGQVFFLLEVQLAIRQNPQRYY
jgi:hypothetical protein